MTDSEPLYSVAVMPDGSVVLYPGLNLTPEDMAAAVEVFLVVSKAIAERTDAAG